MRTCPPIAPTSSGWSTRWPSPGTALEAAIALAEKITANGPLAVAATKRIIVESRRWEPRVDVSPSKDQILMPVFSSNDAKEGAIAFAEKRPPQLDRYLRLES